MVEASALQLTPHNMKKQWNKHRRTQRNISVVEPGEWLSQNPACEKPLQVVLYSLVGIIGGMAYSPFYDTNENLFSKLSPVCSAECQ